jgi:hypothetical protein
LVTLNCNHKYCQKCLNNYILSFQETTNKLYRIKCPEGSCKSLLNFYSILKLLTNKKCKIKLSEQIAEKLKFNSSLIFPKCYQSQCNSLMIKQPQTISLKKHSLLCYCQNQICITCCDIDHSPLTCNEFKSWENNLKNKKEKLNQFWIKKNTKECPKCNLAIGKYFIKLI